MSVRSVARETKIETGFFKCISIAESLIEWKPSNQSDCSVKKKILLELRSDALKASGYWNIMKTLSASLESDFFVFFSASNV